MFGHGREVLPKDKKEKNERPKECALPIYVVPFLEGGFHVSPGAMFLGT